LLKAGRFKKNQNIGDLDVQIVSDTYAKPIIIGLMVVDIKLLSIFAESARKNWNLEKFKQQNRLY